jgi:Flp pilus assembly protein TadD
MGDRVSGRVRFAVFALALLLVAGAALWLGRMRGSGAGGGGTAPVAENPPMAGGDDVPVLAPDDEVHAAYAGSGACKECHAQVYQLWKDSNHGMAEREPRADLDHAAFEPRRELVHGADKSETFLDKDGIARILTRGFGGEIKAYPVVRVIGHRPLRQFLVPAPGNRLQTCDVSHDPKKNEFFDVFGDEVREPGDWGHWTGQGMNWNSMCAGCHNTRVRKNYDPSSDSYRTRMSELGVGCESCHGPMKDHVEWQRGKAGDPARSGSDPTLKRFSATQMLETCAACHARRSEMTGDLVPGEPFDDHFSLVVTDETDTYHIDGQVRDENFEYASFLSSRMHHAGVTCGDCHEPHSGKRLIAGNMLCMRCHGGGTQPPAPVIDPVRHGRHAPGSAGNDCTSCHMPTTVYMQKHPRHDHGFTIPDPLLTKEFGTPNACNRCHTDKDADWALGHVNAWYGARMERPTRVRALAIGRARRGEAQGRDALLGLLATEEIAAWRASFCHLLERWSLMPPVRDALVGRLADPSPLVREAAMRSLLHAVRARDPVSREAARPLLADGMRAVRIAAAWALLDELDLSSRAGKELIHMLDINSDQPVGRMQLSQYAMVRGDREGAVRQIREAIRLDPNSPAFRHDLAVALSTAGDARGAVESLREAVRLAPRDGEFAYKLGLALHEAGDGSGAVEWLEKAVELDPRHARAWYNLGLSRSAAGRPDDAVAAFLKGEQADPADPAIPYARATVHARVGRMDEARAAARKALAADPGHADARVLLERLGR